MFGNLDEICNGGIDSLFLKVGYYFLLCKRIYIGEVFFSENFLFKCMCEDDFYDSNGSYC